MTRRGLYVANESAALRVKPLSSRLPRSVSRVWKLLLVLALFLANFYKR